MSRRPPALPANCALEAPAAGRCGGGARWRSRSRLQLGTATTTTTTTTLPPLAPQVYAYVTMVGTGGNLGLGHECHPIEVSIGGTGPGAAIGVGTYPDTIAITPDGQSAVRHQLRLGLGNTDRPPETGRCRPRSVGLHGVRRASQSPPDGTTAYFIRPGAVGTLGDTITPIDLTTGKTLPPSRWGLDPRASPSLPRTAAGPMSPTPARWFPGGTGGLRLDGHAGRPDDREALAAITSRERRPVSPSPRTARQRSSPTPTRAACRRSTSPTTRLAHPSRCKVARSGSRSRPSSPPLLMSPTPSRARRGQAT